MGVSTDAILVWGFDLGDLSEIENEKIYDTIEALDEDWEAEEKLEKKTGAKLVHHCCPNETMYIVGVTATETVVKRGYPKSIESLTVPPNAQTQLNDFAKAIGVEPKPGQWLLAVWWDGP